MICLAKYTRRRFSVSKTAHHRAHRSILPQVHALCPLLGRIKERSQHTSSISSYQSVCSAGLHYTTVLNCTPVYCIYRKPFSQITDPNHCHETTVPNIIPLSAQEAQPHACTYKILYSWFGFELETIWQKKVRQLVWVRSVGGVGVISVCMGVA